MKFSIIIPTYNRASLIEKTIQSVLNQDFKDFEIIIVDDGSTDNTSEIIEKLDTPQISYFKVKNGERGKARNIGAQYSSGDYVYFLDSDDLLYSFHLQEAYELLMQNESELLWLPYETVDQSGNVIRPYQKSKLSPLKRLLIEGNFLSCHGVFIQRAIALKFPFVEDRNLAGSEDMELWIRLASRYPIQIGDKVTSCLVNHDARSVLNFDNVDALINRKELMLSYVLSDSVVQSKSPLLLRKLKSSAHSYVALHCMLNKKTPPKLAWKYFRKSLLEAPSTILSRRSLAIIKHGFKRAVL